jgi:hypothetical protein
MSGRLTPAFEEVVFALNANAQLATQGFFICNRATGLEVTDVREIHSAAGTDAGAVTIDVFKDTGTGAPGSGASVLSATFNAKGTANTVQVGSLAASQAARQLAQGDRLSIKFTGVLTALAGVQLCVTLKRL